MTALFRWPWQVFKRVGKRQISIVSRQGPLTHAREGGMMRPYLLLLLVLLTGCQNTRGPRAARAPPDRLPFQHSAEAGGRYCSADVLPRRHSQASAAMGAFFADAWGALDEAAPGIAQTARFLATASDPPADLKTRIVQSCGSLQ